MAVENGAPAQSIDPNVGGSIAGNEGTPPTPPAGTPTPPDATPPAPTEPHISFPDQEKFNERLSRNHASQLKKEFGVDSPEELKTKLAEFETLKSAQLVRDQAAMTEQEKHQAQVAQLTADKAALQEERDQVRFESHINGVCAELGVTNVDYAMFELTRAANKLPEGEQLDAREHLSSLLKVDTSRAAFGLPATATQVPVGASTTPTNPGIVPPAPAVPDSAAPDVSKMTRQEFNAHLASKGVGLTGG